MCVTECVLVCVPACVLPVPFIGPECFYCSCPWHSHELLNYLLKFYLWAHNIFILVLRRQKAI